MHDFKAWQDKSQAIDLFVLYLIYCMPSSDYFIMNEKICLVDELKPNMLGGLHNLEGDNMKI